MSFVEHWVFNEHRLQGTLTLPWRMILLILVKAIMVINLVHSIPWVSRWGLHILIWPSWMPSNFKLDAWHPFDQLKKSLFWGGYFVQLCQRGQTGHLSFRFSHPIIVSSFQDLCTVPLRWVKETHVFWAVYLHMKFTTSYLHLPIIIVPLHLCFWSVWVMPTGSIASCSHWARIRFI